jgi:hypothetical protein
VSAHGSAVKHSPCKNNGIGPNGIKNDAATGSAIELKQDQGGWCPERALKKSLYALL